jgi:hypothetical protein
MSVSHDIGREGLTRGGSRNARSCCNSSATTHDTEISKLERALTDPRLSTVVRLARGLGVPTSALVEDRYQDPQLTLEG